VGRRGYGNVYFDEEIDVANLNLDEICHFRNKEIILYQDDDNKPPVGEGLNRKAQVTLDQIWPHDKSTHEPIKDPAQLEIMAYEAKLRRICEKRGTKFVEYRPETGSCVFKVEHFSKYTLDDSDDEGSEVPADGGDPKKAKMTQIQNNKKTIETQDLNRSKQPESTFILGPHPGQRGFQQYNYDIDDAIMREPTSPSVALAKEMKTDTHKLQLMKASFFVDDDYDTRSIMSDMTEGGRESPEQMVPSNIFASKMPNFNREEAPIVIDEEEGISKEVAKQILPSQILKPTGPKSQPLIVRPRVMLYDISDISLPVKESILKNMINEKNASIPFLNGRKFKIGWGKSNEFTVVSSQASKFLFKGRISDDYSKSVVKIQQMKSMKELNGEKFKKSIVDHLKIELKHDKRIVTDTTDCHRLECNSGTEGLYEHFELAQKLSKDGNSLNATIWSLMQALWGNIEENIDAQEHAGIMMRRDFFSSWLENVVEDGSKSNLDYLDRLINLFMCHKISDACELSLENDDMNLSLLIAQTGGGPAVKQLIQHQLCCWHENSADDFIDERRLRVLMMVGGVPAMEGPNSSAINIFENHDWLKCLALQLWYVSSPVASVTDALIAYEQSFENEEANVAMPLPAYKNQLERDPKYFDTRFHLLKLFSQRSHPLETLLHPVGYTTDLMDYRLSFLIAQVLESLGYRHLGDSCE
jgi:nuclear pore complex protein Nup98-Nup96